MTYLAVRPKVWLRTLCSSLLGVALVTPLSLASDKPDFRPFRPVLSSDAERASYLFYIKEYIPFLFEEMQIHGGDFTQFFKQEEELIAALESNEEYLRLKRTFESPLLEFKIDRLAPLSVERKNLRSQETRELSPSDKSLLQEAKDLSVKLDPSQIPFAQLKNRNPKGMITGLILSLADPMIRNQAFRMPPSEQLDFLLAHLTPEAFRDSFRFSQYGFDPSATTKNDVVQAIQSGQTAIRTLEALWLRDLNLASPATAPDHGLLEDSVTPEDKEKRVSQFLNDHALPPESKSTVTAVFEGLLARFSSKTSLAKRPIESTLRLQEVPPNLAVYRGYIGKDCSTSTSFGFPYSPLERIFYIYDSQDRLKGYLGGTIVEQDGERAFYIHDVTGRDLSVEQLKTAVYGLDREKAQLQVKRLIIATPERLGSNMHFLGLISALVNIQEKRPRLHRHLDTRLRNFIGTKGSSMEYDSVKGNQMGHALLTNPEVSELLVTSHRNAPAAYFDLATYSQKYRNPSRADILKIYLAETTDWRGKMDFILNAYPEHKAWVLETEEMLRNQEKLPLLEFTENLRKRFEESGVAPKKKDLGLQKAMKEGITNASLPRWNVKIPAQQTKLMIETAIALLAQPEDDSTALEKTIRSVKAWFRRNPSEFWKNDAFVQALWGFYLREAATPNVLPFQIAQGDTLDPHLASALSFASKDAVDIFYNLKNIGNLDEKGRTSFPPVVQKYTQYFLQLADRDPQIMDALKKVVSNENPSKCALLEFTGQTFCRMGKPLPPQWNQRIRNLTFTEEELITALNNPQQQSAVAAGIALGNKQILRDLPHLQKRISRENRDSIRTKLFRDFIVGTNTAEFFKLKGARAWMLSDLSSSEAQVGTSPIKPGMSRYFPYTYLAYWIPHQEELFAEAKRIAKDEGRYPKPLIHTLVGVADFTQDKKFSRAVQIFLRPTTKTTKNSVVKFRNDVVRDPFFGRKRLAASILRHLNRRAKTQAHPELSVK